MLMNIIKYMTTKDMGQYTEKFSVCHITGSGFLHILHDRLFTQMANITVPVKNFVIIERPATAGDSADNGRHIAFV